MAQTWAPAKICSKFAKFPECVPNVVCGRTLMYTPRTLHELRSLFVICVLSFLFFVTFCSGFRRRAVGLLAVAHWLSVVS